MKPIKIDLFFSGDYLCSTMQSKTLKQAKARYIKMLELKLHQLGGLSFLEEYIYKHSGAIKASFSK